MLESYGRKAHDEQAALTIIKGAETPWLAWSYHRRWAAISRRGDDGLGNREKQEVGRWANNRVEN